MVRLLKFFLFAWAILSPHSPVYAQDKAPPIRADYPVTKVASNIFVIHGPLAFPNEENQGFMNNPAFIVTAAGIVVVDPGGTVQTGEMLLQKIAQHSQQPVVAVFNTHVHGDHWLGNQAIQAKYPEVKIYAHPNMVKIAAAEGASWVSSFMTSTKGASAGTSVVPPTMAVDQNADILIGDTHFRIHHQGKAHTFTDIMIEVYQQDGEHSLFLGDNVFYQRASRIDKGNFQGNIKTIEYALKLNIAHYVPGHGQSGDKSVVMPYYHYLTTLYQAVQKFYDEGISDFEMKDKVRPLMTDWQHWSGFEQQFGGQISLLYLEIEQAAF